MIETYKREAKLCMLSEYDHLAKDGHFMELTEWYNGEGFDITLNNSCGQKNFELTWGEYETLKALTQNNET